MSYNFISSVQYIASTSPAYFHTCCSKSPCDRNRQEQRRRCESLARPKAQPRRRLSQLNGNIVRDLWYCMGFYGRSEIYELTCFCDFMSLQLILGILEIFSSPTVWQVWYNQDLLWTLVFFRFLWCVFCVLKALMGYTSPTIWYKSHPYKI